VVCSTSKKNREKKNIGHLCSCEPSVGDDNWKEESMKPSTIRRRKTVKGGRERGKERESGKKNQKTR